MWTPQALQSLQVPCWGGHNGSGVRVSAQSVTGVGAQSVTRVGAQSVTGVRAQSVTRAGAQSVTRVSAQSGTRLGAQSVTRVSAQSGTRVRAQSVTGVRGQSGTRGWAQSGTRVRGQSGTRGWTQLESVQGPPPHPYCFVSHGAIKGQGGWRQGRPMPLSLGQPLCSRLLLCGCSSVLEPSSL